MDVYSFGIVLWELATREVPWDSELPSGDLPFFKALNHALQTGRRPAIPPAVLAEHGAFVDVMKRCWSGDPVDRPSFSDVVRDISKCVDGVVTDSRS